MEPEVMTAKTAKCSVGSGGNAYCQNCHIPIGYGSGSSAANSLPKGGKDDTPTITRPHRASTRSREN